MIDSDEDMNEQIPWHSLQSLATDIHSFDWGDWNNDSKYLYQLPALPIHV